jgi:CTP:molybdopterin cytidylyltransferase MocA/SAM-dependent methyltransferase
VSTGRDASAVILAAGSGTRFGGGKVRAPLDGRPLLAHVLAAVHEAGIRRVVVVLGRDAGAVLDAVRAAEPAALAGVTVAVNPAPERGLSTSLRLGFGVASAAPAPEGVLFLLADEPRVRVSVLLALLHAPATDGAIAVAPRYEEDAALNPVLLLRAGWPLVAGMDGDRGLGPLLARETGRVTRVPVPGANPDIDTRADLVALAVPSGKAAALVDAWAARVRANREQAERVRELPESGDFYAPVTSMFVDDPWRSGDATLDRLLEMARPGETWLDIGAGAGRYALPLALKVGAVIALDPSAGMLDALRGAMERHGIHNLRLVHARWPVAPPVDVPRADVALTAHLGHDVEEIGTFLEAIEDAAGRLCVAVMTERAPSATVGPFWPVVHGEAHVELPGLREFVAILEARGCRPSAEYERRPSRVFASRALLVAWLRNQLFVAPGSAADGRLEAEVDRQARIADDGTVRIGTAVASRVGIVTWVPRHERPRGGPAA